MIAFDPVESIHASRTQLYRAALAAEQTGDRAAQNILLAVLDGAMWPMAIGGLIAAAAFPAVVGMVACTSLTQNKKGIERVP
jgi:hypothetical protein